MNPTKATIWRRKAEDAELSARIQDADARYWAEAGRDEDAQLCREAGEVHAAIAAFCRAELAKEQVK